MESLSENEAKTEKEYFDEDKKLGKLIAKNMKRSRDHLAEWRREARTAYDFFAGRQWDEKDVDILKEEKRSAVVFNRIPRVINAVAGLEIQNRQEVVYLPRTNDDLVDSDILTAAADYVRDGCDAEDEESQAFKDCLITGVGAIDTHIDYEQNPDGNIIIERVDPLDIDYDPDAEKRNLDDAEWIARTKYYTRERVEEMWPDAVEHISVGSTKDPKGMQPHDATLAPWYINDQSDEEDKYNTNLIEVVQYQYWIREVYYRVEFDDGSIESLSKSEFNKNRDLILSQAVKYIKQYRKTFKQAFAIGEFILEKGDCPVNAFTLRVITGLVDHNKKLWFGLVRPMKDPQMWANKWASQIIDIINKNPKGGYFVEADALEDPRRAEESISSSTFTYLNEDGIGKILPKAVQPVPPNIESMLEYAVTSISEVVGVNLEMLGVTNRDQAAILERERKKAAITVVADFFDALRRYRKEQGRVLADFIMEYLSDGRLIDISGNALGEYVPLFKENLNFEYDIIVDESPTSPNQREVVFDRLSQLVPVLLQAGIPLPPEMLDYAPLPAPLIAAWKKTIEQQSQPDPEAIERQKEQEEATKRLVEVETDLKATQAEKNLAQTDEVKTQSALNVAKAQHEGALAEMEAGHASMDNLRENVKLAVDMLDNP